MRKPQICVIGSSSATQQQLQLAYDSGKVIAETNCIAITGGRFGIMEAVAKGVADHKGISVGILPAADRSDSNVYNTIVIPTGLGYTRNALNILSADLVLVIGGEAGTLNEMTYAWIFKKPMYVIEGSGGWGEKLVGQTMDPKQSDPIRGIKIENLPSLLSAF